jgi:hypothetical protein
MKSLIAVITLLIFAGLAQAQSAPASPFALQKACHTQSLVVLRENRTIWLADSTNRLGMESVTSRFDPSTGICYARTDFVLIVKNGKPHDGVLTSTTIQDAFGGTAYAGNLWLNAEGKQAWEVPNLTLCSVQPRGQKEVLCKTTEEFMALVNKDFGL